MRAATIAVAALLLQVAQLPAQAQDVPAPASESNLTRLLQAELSRWPSRSGVYVKHLGTGEEAGVRAHEHFESASTIKVPIMVLAYQLADQKKLDLSSRYEIEAADYRGGSGIYKYKDPGLKPTLRDVIMEMIITSDNTATDIMVAKVGGKQKLTQWLRQSGYEVLNLNHTTYEYFKLRFASLGPKYAALTAQQVFALGSDHPAFTGQYSELIEQFKADVARGPGIEERMTGVIEQQSSWFGVASPAEMGAILEGIERCTVARKESCDEMKRMLRAQQVRHKIPHYLSVPSGNKTGDTTGVSNDVALIYARSGPIVMTSYNQNVQGQRTELDDRIGELARRIVGYFDGAR